MITRTECSSAWQARFPFFPFFLFFLLVLPSCSEDSEDTNDAGDTDTDSDTDTYPALEDCAEGEGIYDPSCDLCWQDPPQDAGVSWQAALDTCDGLSLGGADDWRLPTVSELRTLIRGCPATETGGECYVNDECLEWMCWSDPCEGCDSFGGPGDEGCYWDPGLEGICDRWYWSSSAYEDDDAYAWGVYFYYAAVSTTDKTDSHGVRCVRSGQ